MRYYKFPLANGTIVQTCPAGLGYGFAAGTTDVSLTPYFSGCLMPCNESTTKTQLKSIAAVEPLNLCKEGT